MKSLFGLPVSLLVFIWDLPSSHAITSATTKTVTATSTQSITQGSGSAYASSCNSASLSWDRYTSSWIKANANVSVTTAYQGGKDIEALTYYLNASTLCDGHPRVTYSPAIPLYTKTTTTTGPITASSVYSQTVYYGQPPGTSPACSISPKDCDPLWQDYTKTLKQWQAQNASHSMTGDPPHTPFCMNQTAASQYASATSAIYGCGDCTIYGDGVELLFFPPPATVSRDMCAHTQSGTLTHYGTDDVITAWHGKSSVSMLPNSQGAEVVEYDGHVFTSGTAYISISSVWAVDRCSKDVGTTLHDAVLAMRSQDVLSLRYSQNHFQALWSTDQQTGYPVSYADFRNPIPFSAWIGQTICDGPWDNYRCGVIYENNFRPQLAIPPGIKKLDPKWSTCQMYFRGLYDPPVALQKVSSIAGIKTPGGVPAPVPATTEPLKQPGDVLTTPAQPAPTYAQPTPTKQAEEGPTTNAPTPDGSSGNTPGASTQPASTHRPKHRRVRTKTIDIDWATYVNNKPKTVTQPITILEKHVIIITVIQLHPANPITIECSALGLSTVLADGQTCTANIPPSFGNQGASDQSNQVVFKAAGTDVEVQYSADDGDGDNSNAGTDSSGASSGSGETSGNGDGNTPADGDNNNDGSGYPGTSSGSGEENGNGNTPAPNGPPGNNGHSGVSSSGEGATYAPGTDNGGSEGSGSSSTSPTSGPTTSSGQSPTSSIAPQRGGASKQNAWLQHITAISLPILYFAVI